MDLGGEISRTRAAGLQVATLRAQSVATQKGVIEEARREVVGEAFVHGAWGVVEASLFQVDAVHAVGAHHGVGVLVVDDAGVVGEVDVGTLPKHDGAVWSWGQTKSRE